GYGCVQDQPGGAYSVGYALRQKRPPPGAPGRVPIRRYSRGSYAVLCEQRHPRNHRKGRERHGVARGQHRPDVLWATAGRRIGAHYSECRQSHRRRGARPDSCPGTHHLGTAHKSKRGI
ncbi:uncharacterized protein METZ01_LOCUS473892, partial [marine metagenome]